MDLHDRPWLSYTQTLTTLRGSSPNSQVVARSMIDLPRHFEFDQVFRYVGPLPAQNVESYETADVHFGRYLTHGLSFSLVGQNLLQPHHQEFGIAPGPNVGIKRGFYARVTWRSGR